MLYAIIATDIANSLDQRLAARPAHLARLTQLQSEGRLVLAGPHPAIDSNDPGAAGFSGSLIVAESTPSTPRKAGPTPTPTVPLVCMPTCW